MSLYSNSLWYWEHYSGRTLLGPRVYQGLGAVPLLTRQICDEESDPELAADAPIDAIDAVQMRML